MGRNESTRLYEMIDWSDKLKGKTVEDYLTLFYKAFKSYELGDFKLAINQFDDCLVFFNEDMVVKVLKERCHELLLSHTPEDWDGTFLMVHK
jgi:hypothetical protein